MSVTTAPRRLVTLVASCAALAFAGDASPLSAQQADSTRAGVRPPRDTARRADSARQAAVQRAIQDSTLPPLSPGKAFLYSLALPGLAQAKLGRGSSGNVYFLYEALSWTMLAKSVYDLRIAKRHKNDAIINTYEVDPATGNPVRDDDGNPVPVDTLRNRYAENRVKARRTHVEDWVASLIFTHLFAGADAYVSSHLWDLPVHVGFRAAPAVPIIRALRRY
jgi:hypothetical protein